ncbi:MAG TPA: hypothetical protein VE684_03700 [Crenalkalicoccus sp.]|jgi:hypothetical protein|nr:hypothetical protein [Crenalkalicoccus sp.]
MSPTRPVRRIGDALLVAAVVRYAATDGLAPRAATYRTVPTSHAPVVGAPADATAFGADDASPAHAALHDRLLPLPHAHYDPGTGRVEVSDQELLRYYRRVFQPIAHHRIFPDFPKIARCLADIAEQRLPGD